MIGMSRTDGTPMEGDDHIIQSVQDILTTPKGTRAMLREYGSRLPDLVDRPQNELLDVELQAAVAEALDKWEPRFKLSRVWISARSSEGRVVLGVEGTIVSEGRVFRIEGIVI